MSEYRECDECGCSSEDSDIYPCGGCGRGLCDECAVEPDDDDCPDYFCRQCIRFGEELNTKGATHENDSN